jgi:hypothetical protein
MSKFFDVNSFGRVVVLILPILVVAKLILTISTTHLAKRGARISKIYGILPRVHFPAIFFYCSKTLLHHDLRSKYPAK